MGIFDNLSGLSTISFDQINENPEGSQMSTGFSNPVPSFEEISYDRKFSQEDKCKVTKGDFYKANMDLNKLLNHISDRTNDTFFFYYQNYALDNITVSAGVTPITGIPLTSTYTPAKYFEYTKGNEKKSVEVSVELNQRPCFVSLQKAGSVFYLNPERKEMDFRLEFVYTDYLDKREFNSSTGKYNLDKKYNAIIISISDIEGFIALCERLRISNQVKNEITDLFVEKIKQTKDAGALKFLYENMPDFISEEILNRLDMEMGVAITVPKDKNAAPIKNSTPAQEFLWSHLELLSDYDDKGFFSWATDSSGALINLLKIFKNSQFLFESFKNNQAMVKRIFNNMDKTSVVDGTEISNKTLFANFINALCMDNAFEGLRMVNKEFVIGDNYAFSSGDFFQEEKDNEFFLQQLKKVTRTETEIIPDDLPSHVERIQVDRTSLDPAEKGNLYHPMDIVRVRYDGENNFAFPFVSAISIKALAEAREQQELEKNIRIGLDIFLIVVGTATMLTTANPTVFALAFADVALASADGVITANREEIAAMPGGKEFLDKWEKIYIIGGIILATPATVEFLFARAAGLYRAAIAIKNFNYANFFKSCMVKIMLEREILTFAGNTVKSSSGIEIKILEYNSQVISKATNFNFGKYDNLLPLYEKGAILVEVEGKEYALVYKGERLIQGAPTDKFLQKFFKELKKVYRYPEKLVVNLEELYKLRHLPDDVLEHASLGEFAAPGNPNRSTLPGKMKSGGHSQENINFLDKIGRKYKVEHTYENGVRIGAVEGHDSKFKRLIEGQTNTGQSWFPESWDKTKIKLAGGYVIERNLEAFKILEDGIPIFDNFDGVRVGVMKTRGKPATIFPDNAKQPLLNSNKFEFNPF